MDSLQGIEVTDFAISGLSDTATAGKACCLFITVSQSGQHFGTSYFVYLYGCCHFKFCKI